MLQSDVEGCALSPFTKEPPLPFLFIHACSLIPKGLGWRLINDWSRATPWGPSVNDLIDTTRDIFDAFDDIVRRFIRVGPTGWQFKGDFKGAYKQIRIRALDLHLAGVFAPELGYSFYVALCFGAKSSGHIWERAVVCFLALLRVGFGVVDVAHWVDDLFKVCTSRKEAQETLLAVYRVAYLFGFRLAPDKMEYGQALPYCGITFDSKAMALTIHESKRVKAMALVASLRQQAHWSRKQFESLKGHLYHYARVIHPLRPFAKKVNKSFRTLFNKPRADLRGAPSKRCLNALRLFEHVLASWSNTMTAQSLAPHLGLPGPPCVVFRTDSSPVWGFGIICISTGEWCACSFSPRQLDLAMRSESHSSTLLETFPFAVILATFADTVKGKHVIIESDSQNAVLGLETRSSDIPEQADFWLLFTAAQINSNCSVTGKHIFREQNKAADALSKNDVDSFHRESQLDQLFVRRSPIKASTASLRLLSHLSPE